MRGADGTPTATSRVKPSRRLLGAVLAAGLAWIGACATGSPPQVAADLDPSPPPAGLEAPAVDQGEGALAFTGQARAFDTANPSAILTGTDALIVPGLIDDGEAVLSALRDVSDALLQSGRIAEDRHDWEMAMRTYEALPADNPQRTSSLQRAKLQWRQSNLSACAQQALGSPVLTRAELAVLLVSLAPQLESVGNGSSVVLSDIIDLPCYRGVLTAVRCDLIAVDRLEHRFFPSRAARPEEVRRAVEGLCRILNLKKPVWCRGEEVGTGCTLIAMPVRGQQVAELVSLLTETEQP